MAATHSPLSAKELFRKRFGKFRIVSGCPHKVFYVDDAVMCSKMKYLEGTIIGNVFGRDDVSLLTEHTAVLTSNFAESAGEPMHQQVVDVGWRNKETEVEDLRRRNLVLSDLLEKHQPHKQFLRTSLIFLLFFSATLMVQVFGGIWLMSYPLAWSGVAVSTGTILLSYFAAVDWKNWRSRGNHPH